MTATTINRPRTVALVDFNYHFKKNFCAMPGAEPLAAAKKTLEEFARARETSEHVILCIDAPPYKRRETFAEYKAHREPPTIQETEQRRWLRDKCMQLGYQTAWSKGYEADDCIATLARIYGEWCEEVRILGSDKDVAQCVTDNVIQYVPAVGERKEDRRDRLKVKVKFGVYPEQMALYLALAGDAPDNVPGVPGFGPKTAARFVTEYRTLRGLAEALATQGNDPKNKDKNLWRKLADHWGELKVSLDLVTLDANVPLDAEGLLMKLTPQVSEDMTRQMDVDLDGFMGNATPEPESLGTDAVLDDAETTADQGYRGPADKAAFEESERNADRAAREQQEQERKLEEARQAGRDIRAEASPVGKQMLETADRAVARQVQAAPAAPANEGRPPITEAEFDPISRAPEGYVAPPLPPKEEKARFNNTGPVGPSSKTLAEQRATEQREKPKSPMAITVPEQNYGLATEDLQPQDLRSARLVSEWLCAAHLYPQFDSPTKVFAIIARGKELGIKMTTALSAFHMVEGKPTASADLIRALAKADPKCAYFRLIESTSTYAIWETWCRDDVDAEGKPAPTRLRYDLEEAEQAGIASRKMWRERPRQMLAKTCSSILARLVYPGATMGLYCAEEMGEEREAA